MHEMKAHKLHHLKSCSKGNKEKDNCPNNMQNKKRIRKN